MASLHITRMAQAPGFTVDALSVLCYTPNRKYVEGDIVPGPVFSLRLREQFYYLLEDESVPTITFVRENKQVEVPEGDSVRYPALENDVPVYCGLWKFANCHGNGLCGTDRVIVSPSSNTNPLTLMEKFWLRNDLKKTPNIRLSCQVQVFGDVNVDTRCE